MLKVYVKTQTKVALLLVGVTAGIIVVVTGGVTKKL
jgi:hypothetical protein